MMKKIEIVFIILALLLFTNEVNAQFSNSNHYQGSTECSNCTEYGYVLVGNTRELKRENFINTRWGFFGRWFKDGKRINLGTINSSMDKFDFFSQKEQHLFVCYAKIRSILPYRSSSSYRIINNGTTLQITNPATFYRASDVIVIETWN